MKEIQLIEYGSIEKISTDDLKRYLKNGFQITAKNLYSLSLIWKELTIRGVDLSEFKNSAVTRFLPLISDNIISSEFIVKYSGQRMLINHIKNLPIRDREKIMNDEYVEVLDFAKNGNNKVVKKPLKLLNAKEITMILTATGIKSITDQKVILERISTKKRKKSFTALISINKIDNTIEVGKQRTSISLVIEKLSQHYGVDIEGFVLKNISNFEERSKNYEN